MIFADERDGRSERRVAPAETADGGALPGDFAPARGVLPSGLQSERECIVAIRYRCGDPSCNLSLDHAMGGRKHAAAAFDFGIGAEAKAVEDTGPLTLHHDRTALPDDREKRFVRTPAVVRRPRPAVDEELGQLRVERIGKRVLERPGALLPPQRIVHPVCAMGHVSPGPHMADAGCQRIDVALGGRQPLDRTTDPRRWQAAALDQRKIDPADETDMILRHGLPEIWDLADLPEERDTIRAG